MVGFALFVKKQISNPTQPDQKEATQRTATKTDKPKKDNTVKRDAIILSYFRQQVRDGIETALRKGVEPRQKAVLKVAFNATVDRQNVGSEKLRKDITPAMQADIYGKIYREELETKNLYIRGKR